MKKLGEILKGSRESQNLTLEKVASELLLKKEYIEALETGDWQALPEPGFVRGFIKSYAQLLGLDSERLQALYRAEFDEKKYPQNPPIENHKKKFFIIPRQLAPATVALAILAFLIYLFIQYTSVLQAPQLEIFTPANDTTTTASVIEISGQSEKDATVSIDGTLVSVDESGKFYHQIELTDGQNFIEIIASKKLSPKTKTTRLIRLSR